MAKLTAKSTAANRIVVRQAMDKTSGIFTNSPDLITTGTSPAFDPDSFTDPDAYGWYFSQAVVTGAGNYVYVRGVNYTPTGAQTSRVYFYYVTSDQLLDPSKWQSSGFTVNGAAQNWVTLTAVSQYQYVATNPPAVWTPPKPSSSSVTYFLISWVDNSANPVPPTWPSTPFANLDALNAYVSDHQEMAVLDTVYRGAFLRQFPGQLVTTPATGAQTSPDLVVSGAAAAKDASAYTTSASYNSTTLNATVALDLRNFLYIRAINTTSGPVTARVYLYWTTASDISPPSWNATNFTYAGRTQNWVDLIAASAGEVMVSTVPLVWAAPPSVTDPPILIAYVDNSENPQPPDFSAFGYVNAKAVTSFVAGHPQLSWLTLSGQQVPTPTMTSQSPLSAGTGAGTAYAGIQLANIPVDGTVSLSVPGPDAANTIVVTGMKVPDPNAFVSWPVTYPDHFQTSAVITYTKGTTPPSNGSIVATLVPRPATAR